MKPTINQKTYQKALQRVEDADTSWESLIQSGNRESGQDGLT